MSRRDEIARLIWGEVEPLTGPARAAVDLQGWASNHPYLLRALDEVRPQVVVEIGVWKGMSVLTMAGRLKEMGVDGAILAVDTWLGAWDHWLQPQWFVDLKMDGGYPTLYQTFVANVLERGLAGQIVPLPLDSLNAARVVRERGIPVDVLHVDAAHDFASVTADLTAWWPLLRDGGILIGDDYHAEGDTWPEVRQAFQAFFGTVDIEAIDGKCYIRKEPARTGPLYVR